MKIDFFRTLGAVLETGSFAGAAKAVHLTPSAVSMQMKQLEQYFGRSLFDRSGLQVRPTAFARELGATMSRALDEVDHMRQRDTHAVTGELKVGLIDSMQPAMLPRIMRAARLAHPGLVLLPIRGRSADLVEAVKAGRIDAAIVAQPERPTTRRLDWRPVKRRELIMIAPPEARDESIRALFDRYEWIRFDPNSITGRIVARFVQAEGLRVHATVELQTIQSIFSMVNAGLGVSILLSVDPRLCMGFPVRIIGLGPDAPALQISLVSRTADQERRPMQALKALVEEVLRVDPVTGSARIGDLQN